MNAMETHMKPTTLAAVTATVIAAVVAFASVCGSAVAQDKAEKTARPDALVTLEGGQQKKRPGKVESADFEKVVFTDLKGGKKTEIPAADIFAIEWGDAPAGYEDGVRALGAGDWEAARVGFNDAIREKDVKPDLGAWLLDFGNAGLGRALLQLGQADKAAEAFTKARSANAKSFLTDQILLGLAEAELARGKGDAAARAADDLIAAAKTARRPAWELGAYLVRSKGKLQAGDWSGAASAFDDTIRFAENAAASEKNADAKKRLQSAGIEAAVRKGWAMVAKGEATKSNGDFDAARSYFDGLASKYPAEPVVLASAVNAAGVAKFAAGDFKGAIRLFQTAEVVHFRAGDEVARAYWYQAECWKKLGNEQNRADRIKDLKEEFPGSEWARRAQ